MSGTNNVLSDRVTVEQMGEQQQNAEDANPVGLMGEQQQNAEDANPVGLMGEQQQNAEDANPVGLMGEQQQNAEDANPVGLMGEQQQNAEDANPVVAADPSHVEEVAAHGQSTPPANNDQAHVNAQRTLFARAIDSILAGADRVGAGLTAVAKGILFVATLPLRIPVFIVTRPFMGFSGASSLAFGTAEVATNPNSENNADEVTITTSAQSHATPSQSLISAFFSAISARVFGAPAATPATATQETLTVSEPSTLSVTQAHSQETTASQTMTTAPNVEQQRTIRSYMPSMPSASSFYPETAVNNVSSFFSSLRSSASTTAANDQPAPASITDAPRHEAPRNTMG